MREQNKVFRLITVTLPGSGSAAKTIRQLIEEALAAKSPELRQWDWDDVVNHVQIHPDSTNDITIEDSINGDSWDYPSSNINNDYIIDAVDVYDAVRLKSANAASDKVAVLEFMLIKQ